MNKKVKKAFRVLGIVILSFFAVVIVLMTALCIYHQCKLKKERNLIKHVAGQYVEVGGDNMNVYLEGEGDKTLVFLAGYGTPSPVFDFKPLYEKLSDKYRIVVIEKFGYGYSDEQEGERSLDVVVDQHREALKNLGLEGPFILTAHSAGGAEAIWWAQHYPEEVEAIIGLDCNIPEQYDAYKIPTDFNAMKPQNMEECISGMATYDFFNYQIGLIRLMPMPPAASSRALTEEEREQYKALGYVMYCKGSGATFQRETIMTEQALGAMREYHDGPIPDIPTLLFVSDGSVMKQVMEPEDWIRIHENYVSSLSNGKLIKLDCGHYVHAERPEKIANGMISFLDGLPETSAMSQSDAAMEGK